MFVSLLIVLLEFLCLSHLFLVVLVLRFPFPPVHFHILCSLKRSSTIQQFRYLGRMLLSTRFYRGLIPLVLALSWTPPEALGVGVARVASPTTADGVVDPDKQKVGIDEAAANNKRSKKDSRGRRVPLLKIRPFDAETDGPQGVIQKAFACTKSALCGGVVAAKVSYSLLSFYNLPGKLRSACARRRSGKAEDGKQTLRRPQVLQNLEWALLRSFPFNFDVVLELEKHEYDEIVGKIADPELRKEAELATSFFELTHVEHAVTMQVLPLPATERLSEKGKQWNAEYSGLYDDLTGSGKGHLWKKRGAEHIVLRKVIPKNEQEHRYEIIKNNPHEMEEQGGSEATSSRSSSHQVDDVEVEVVAWLVVAGSSSRFEAEQGDRARSASWHLAADGNEVIELPEGHPGVRPLSLFEDTRKRAGTKVAVALPLAAGSSEGPSPPSSTTALMARVQTENWQLLRRLVRGLLAKAPIAIPNHVCQLDPIVLACLASKQEQEVEEGPTGVSEDSSGACTSRSSGSGASGSTTAGSGTQGDDSSTEHGSVDDCVEPQRNEIVDAPQVSMETGPGAAVLTTKAPPVSCPNKTDNFVIRGPRFVSHHGIRDVPVFGTICNSWGGIFVNRDCPESRKACACGILEHCDRWASRNPFGTDEGVDLDPMIVFPEGGLSNGEFLTDFKSGALSHPTAPVRPVLLKYLGEERGNGFTVHAGDHAGNMSEAGYYATPAQLAAALEGMGKEAQSQNSCDHTVDEERDAAGIRQLREKLRKSAVTMDQKELQKVSTLQWFARHVFPGSFSGRRKIVMRFAGVQRPDLPRSSLNNGEGVASSPIASQEQASFAERVQELARQEYLTLPKSVASLEGATSERTEGARNFLPASRGPASGSLISKKHN